MRQHSCDARSICGLRSPAEPVVTREGNISVSLSLGAAVARRTLPQDQFLKAADEALYRAKRGGRNRVGTRARLCPPWPGSFVSISTKQTRPAQQVRVADCWTGPKAAVHEFQSTSLK